jgi:hypothetical protein
MGYLNEAAVLSHLGELTRKPARDLKIDTAGAKPVTLQAFIQARQNALRITTEDRGI